MSLSEWVSLWQLIIKNGSLTIPVHPYEEIRTKELAEIGNGTPKKAVASNFRKKFFTLLLRLPLIGPLIASISFYRYQKKWPTYVLHVPKHKLAYVRISKSACTSIQAALLQIQLPDLDIKSLSNNQINYLGMNFIKPYLLPGYHCFTVVREPVNRLISCYNDKCIQSNPEFFYFQDYLFRIIKPGIGIKEFVELLQQIPKPLQDIHFRPQSCFLNSLENVQIFRLEYDYESLVTFLAEFGAQLHHRHKKENPKIVKEEISPQILNVIQNIYMEDYECFDYPLKN